jgi:hypothetical protein
MQLGTEDATSITLPIEPPKTNNNVCCTHTHTHTHTHSHTHTQILIPVNGDYIVVSGTSLLIKDEDVGGCGDTAEGPA